MHVFFNGPGLAVLNSSRRRRPANAPPGCRLGAVGGGLNWLNRFFDITLILGLPFPFSPMTMMMMTYGDGDDDDDYADDGEGEGDDDDVADDV